MWKISRQNISPISSYEFSKIPNKNKKRYIYLVEAKNHIRDQTGRSITCTQVAGEMHTNLKHITFCVHAGSRRDRFDLECDFFYLECDSTWYQLAISSFFTFTIFMNQEKAKNVYHVESHFRSKQSQNRSNWSLLLPGCTQSADQHAHPCISPATCVHAMSDLFCDFHCLLSKKK